MKMIKRTTYLKGERKCIEPMNGKEDETPQRRRRSLMREWKQGRTGNEEEARKKNVWRRWGNEGRSVWRRSNNEGIGDLYGRVSF